MRRALALVILLAAVAPRAAWPQGGAPLGPEFRVNTYTTSNQIYPSVTRDSGGNFVVVWTSNLQDGDALGVFGQRYATAGGPLGPEFKVNTYTTGVQDFAVVASAAAGNFVVVWHSAQDGSGYGIFGQRYASTGAPLGPEFRVNTYTTNPQTFPSVASDSAGNFVVVWASGGQDGSSNGVFGQRYASSGAPLGPEFRVNTNTPDYQGTPSVASDSAGNFVVVWTSNVQDGSLGGVFGQRYASTGAPVGPEFRVNTYTTGSQYRAAVADTAGGFVVVWQSDAQDGSVLGVFGQRYASTGAPVGPEFLANSYTTGNQQLPSVAGDASGNFVVAWTNGGGYAAPPGDIAGQRYVSNGTPQGAEFRVNTFTTNDQTRASVASDPSGNFVVIWDSQVQDGAGLGVFGQRYGQIVPVELMRFGVE